MSKAAASLSAIDEPPPASAQELFHAGTRRLATGEFDAAEQLLRAALLLNPALAEAHANLGLVLEGARRDGEAEGAYRRALALAPRDARTWSNFGVLLERLRRDAEAEAAYREALALDPADAAAWTNLGVLLETLRRDAEAEACQRHALELAPGWARAEVNLATLLLRQGRFDEGWRRLEARDWYVDLERALGLPRWHGEDLHGRAILIGIEAGHGDMIQFCRYAAELKRRGAARVGILCHPALAGLLRGAAGVDAVIAAGVAADPDAADSGWDCWCPPLSLPGLCATGLDTVPAELPYIAVDGARAARWRQRLGPPGAALRVGLVWKGNPRFAHDAERSLRALRELAPLAALPGVRCYSVQKGGGEEETAAAPFGLIDLGPEIADFADLAAILLQLDLLISVDTAAAHLAGALGRRCWLLLPARKTDWRWLEARADTPWYPGVLRLFRQRPDEDWDAVIATVAAALRALAGARQGGG